MIQVATLPPEATGDTLTTIAQNICNQLLAFQNTIEARPPQERYPSAPELNMLCKMLNCLEKIKRMQKAATPARLLQSFLTFVKQNDETTGKKLKALLSAFTAGEAEKNTTSADEMPYNTAPQTYQESEQTKNSGQPNDEPQPPLPTPDASTPAGGPPPLISLDDFMVYSKLLLRLNAPPTEKSTIRGHEYNTNWLQYNLYQWCLPAEKRRFHYDEHRYAKQIDHSSIKREIGRLLEKQGVTSVSMQ